MSTYLKARSEGAQVTAIPVFPHRRFRHSYIYVNRDAGIARPKHLAGRRVDLPEYQITSTEACYRRMQDARLWALVWNRALYDEEREVFGHDAFPYGIEANGRTLDALIRYSHQRGLLESPPESLQSLFPAHMAVLRYYESPASGDT